jgi:Flp pilus assembly protein TadG
MAGRSVRGYAPGARAGHESGAAAVEFALVSVLLFPLLFAIIQYGFLFFQLQGASATAHEAARLASLGISNCDTYGTSIKASADANGLNATNDATWSLSVAYPNSTNVPTTAERFEPVDVTLTFTPTTFGLPFVPLPGMPMTREGRAMVENVGACDAAFTRT